MSANEEVVEEGVVTQVDEAPPERDWEAEARQTGWVPKEEFRGDPQKWIDAQSYVQKGETFIPLLRKSNSELKNRLGGVEEELQTTRRMLQAATQAIQELKEDSRENTLESAQTRKEQLYDAIAAAREAGNVRQELELREQLDDVNQEIRQAKTKPAAQPASNGEDRPWERNPIHQQFMKDNPWFGVDQEKTNIALGYMNYLNTNPEMKGMSPQERYNAIDKRIRDLYPSSNPRRSGPSRVEGGRPSGGGGRGTDGGPRFDDLPAAAREQCDAQASRFVGKTNGRGEVKYKTLEDYRAHFTKVYNDDSWGTKHLTGGK